VPVLGSIGDWNVRGLADLIAIWPHSENSVKIRVFEIKASWKERTYHRVQVAIYALLFSEAIRDLGILYEIEGGITQS
jgi:predicted RecB family nuclease